MIRELRYLAAWIAGIFGPGACAFWITQILQSFGVEFYGSAYAPQAVAIDNAYVVTGIWGLVCGLTLIGIAIHDKLWAQKDRLRYN